jgi:hypothetical protein
MAKAEAIYLDAFGDAIGEIITGEARSRARRLVSSLPVGGFLVFSDGGLMAGGLAFLKKG